MNNRPSKNVKTNLLPEPLDHTFTAPIGVDVKGELWSCVEMPDSAEFFGTKKAIRVDATIDGIELPNIGLMVTGKGGHMLSVSAKLRKQLGKNFGDKVTVHLTRRLT
jgi:uncharacterized protein DUF1905